MQFSVQTLARESENNLLNWPRIELAGAQNSESFAVVYNAPQPGEDAARLVTRIARNPGENEPAYAQRVYDAAQKLRATRLSQWRTLAFELDRQQVHSPDAFARVVIQKQPALAVNKSVTVKYVAFSMENESDAQKARRREFDAGVEKLQGVQRVDSQAQADIAWLEDENVMDQHPSFLRKEAKINVQKPRDADDWSKSIVRAVLELREQRLRPPAGAQISRASIADLVAQLAV